MKTEYIVGAIMSLFIFGYVLDILSPVALTLTNPFQFLTSQMLSTYPFTAVSVGAKTVSIFMSVLLISLVIIGGKYIANAVFLFVVAALMELYAIQQLATSSQMVSVQWNLAISYAGVALIIPCVIYLVLGIIRNIHNNFVSDSTEGLRPDSEVM